MQQQRYLVFGPDRRNNLASASQSAEAAARPLMPGSNVLREVNELTSTGLMCVRRRLLIRPRFLFAAATPRWLLSRIGET